MQILKKRTADNRLFYIDCSHLLDVTETITSITSITADQGGLAFASQSINNTVITFANGRQAQPGKVILVLISGGAIPVGQKSLLCIVRALMLTSVSPALEATVPLELTDTPGV